MDIIIILYKKKSLLLLLLLLNKHDWVMTFGVHVIFFREKKFLLCRLVTKIFFIIFSDG